MANILKIIAEVQAPKDQISGADLVTVKRDFTDAYWTKTATAEKDVGIAPDGTFTAGRLTDTSGGSTQYAYHDFTTTAQPYLASIDVRSETGIDGEIVELYLRGFGGGTTDPMLVGVNLLTGEVTSSPGAADVIYSDVLLGVGQGFHRVRLFFNSDGGTIRYEIHPPDLSSMLIVDPVLVPIPQIVAYNAAYRTYAPRYRIAQAGAENGRVSGVGVLSDEKEVEQ